jgi:hypothetical protein
VFVSHRQIGRALTIFNSRQRKTPALQPGSEAAQRTSGCSSHGGC